MKIEVLGSGNEVGRSAIIVEDNNSKVLLDCGVKLNPEPPAYPIINKHIADAAIISHAHLDHSGGSPLLFKNSTMPIFMNDLTLELTSLLVRDSIKVGRKQGYGTPFSENDAEKMIKTAKIVAYGENFSTGNFLCQLYDSGHIPGSSSVMIKSSKKVFYTADIQTEDTNLLYGCRLPKKADVLITESTYSYKDHPNRLKEEKKLIEHVEEAINGGGVALVPVFAVGRAQEVLLILEEFADRIALDGMSKASSQIIASYASYIKDPERFRRILKKIKFVYNDKDRLKALKKYRIIVASAGMMGGGPVLHYLREIKKMAESKVLFTGFLVEESPGRNLLETKIFKNSEEKYKVECDVQKIDLSAHAGKSGLMNIINHTKPEQVICVHGDHCKEFAKELSSIGIEAFAPSNGEILRV